MSVVETRVTDHDGKPSEDPGGVLIDVAFVQNGSEIYHESRDVDAQEENTEFYQTFQDEGPPVAHDVSAIYAQFGSYGGHDGVRIWGDGLEGEIDSLEVTYADIGNVEVNAGNITITSSVTNASKTADILVARG